MKYYVVKLKHDKGCDYVHTCASGIEGLKSVITGFYNCPLSAIDFKEIPFSLKHRDAEYLFNYYVHSDKQTFNEQH